LAPGINRRHTFETQLFNYHRSCLARQSARQLTLPCA
jgi:hypothetical protein